MYSFLIKPFREVVYNLQKRHYNNLSMIIEIGSVFCYVSETYKAIPCACVVRYGRIIFVVLLSAHYGRGDLDHDSNRWFSAPANQVRNPVVLENRLDSNVFILGLGRSGPDGAVQNARYSANADFNAVSILYRSISRRKSRDPAKPVYEYGSLLPGRTDHRRIIS